MEDENWQGGAAAPPTLWPHWRKRHWGGAAAPPDQELTMQEMASIQCPFCGECFELVIDATQPAQRFTTDCEICCRPMQVSVTCEAGEILDLQATPD